MFARTPTVTIRSSAAAFRLKLWDEEDGSLVPFSSARQDPAQRKPMWLMPVSIICGRRAAGR